MKNKVMHLIKKIQFKDSWTSNGTLCGKSQWQGGDSKDCGGNNVTIKLGEVTCKLCLREMKKQQIIN